MKNIGVCNRGLRRLRHLPILLDANIVPVYWPIPKNLDATLGWGHSPYGQRAQAIASQLGIPFIRIEDGFLRSIALGKDEPPLSIVYDDVGIYYDAENPSRLEDLIKESLADNQLQRTRQLLTVWREARVSKYNLARDYPLTAIFKQDTIPPYVLLADQTYGDASLRYGLADTDSFQRMLDAALSEHPESLVAVKVHPEVVAGRKQGHFNITQLAQHPRVRVVGDLIHPACLLEHAQAVYVATSQIGFEALLWEKPVRVFGMPFYAGWGLTQDELPQPERRCPVTLENLVYASLVAYPRYLHPETQKLAEVEDIVAWLGLQRRMRSRFPENLYAFNFSNWKKPIVRDFFQGSQIHFIDYLPQKGHIVSWGKKLPEISKAQKNQVNLLRLEDGFIRSVGLGADLIRPLSWVIDNVGIYYDATQPSALETLLQHQQFNNHLLERAKQLRERLVADGLTKYNVGQQHYVPGCKHGTQTTHPKTIILVPGQVESDASLVYGAPGLNRNLDLLYTVRKANPEAYIIYKPHPDVVAGLRKAGDGEQETVQWCDEVVVDVSMATLLNHIDEVHTLTSLTGFEALLRSKTVVCYGQPFYAGWGLTRDIIPIPRRTRILQLDELVAGTLVLYPTYVSRRTGKFTTPEQALDELLAWRLNGTSTMPWWRKALRWFLTFSKF